MLRKSNYLLKLKNMDFKQIQELIKMVNKSNIGELTVELKDFRVTIKQKEEKVQHVITSPVHTSQAMQHVPAHTAVTPSVAPASGTENRKEEPAAASNTITIKSPMIGTFYRKAGPDKPNFAEIGDEINP